MYLKYSGFFNLLRKRYFKKILISCNLKPSGRVLDYGCGPGDLLIVAKEIGVDAVGIDSSPRSTEIAYSRGLKVYLADEKSLTYPINSFDAIILQSVIEHLDKPIETLKTLKQFLRPGGVLVLSAPTPGPHFWDDPTHVRPFTPASMHTLGELLELKTERVTYVFAFLLGFTCSAAFIFKLMNISSLALGSNLVAFYRKP
jgi:SAM-dependent methyltransferase